MKIFISIKKTGLLLATGALLFTSCNKLELDPVPVSTTVPGTQSLAAMLDDPAFSILKAAVTKANLLPTLGSASVRLTVFAPDNTAFTSSGVPLDSITSWSVAKVTGLVQYHVIPQSIGTGSISTAFPNFDYPTILNPTTGTPLFNPFVRLSTYPSKRGSAVWVNNIPVTQADVIATNGVLHKVARLVGAPSSPLWARIATDPDLTFLKAAIQRADSGATPTLGTLNQSILQSVLTEFGPKLTVFAPTDAAFKATLYQAAYPLVYQQVYTQAYNVAIGGGATPAQADAGATAYATANAPALATGLTSSPTVFQNPLLFGALTAERVKGIVVYHLLGKTAFSVNFPTTAGNFPTLLNSAIPVHPGIAIQSTFTGPFVSAITVKGLGNAAAANVLVNPLPNPFGSSDQHFINGTLHKIDQVLLPQ